MTESEKFSFDKAESYGRLARTVGAADVGDWVMFTFDAPVSCRRMKVATGNFQLPRYTFENGYVEVSYDGVNFERVGDLYCGMFFIESPQQPIKAVRITSTSRGNGAEWVSIQPPTIWPKL
jgi:hexosaminidase